MAPVRNQDTKNKWASPLMRRLLFALLLNCAVCFPSLRAEVIVNDQIWSGTRLINEKVIVERGATLLIQPGSTLTFTPIPVGAEKGGGRLIVFGRLIAQGTKDAPIVFTSSAAHPHPGDWEGLRFEKANETFSRLDFCRIEYAQAGVYGHSSFVQIAESLFSQNQIGFLARSGLVGSISSSIFSRNVIGLRFEQSDNLRLVNSEIADNEKSGVLCANSSPLISNSRIRNNGEHGIACLRGASPLIENNLIEGQKYGLWAEMNANPILRHNELIKNDTAVQLQRLSFAQIEWNLIARNRIGLFCNLGGYPRFRHNNVIEQREFAAAIGDRQSVAVARKLPFDRRVEMNLPLPKSGQQHAAEKVDLFAGLPTEGLIDAVENWWGTIDFVDMQTDKRGKNPIFGDSFATPSVDYRGETFPRDRINFTPWAFKAFEQAGRRQLQYSGITGRVLRAGQPVSGVRIHVYPLEGADFTDEGLTFSSPTATDGGFFLPLKAESYQLLVKAPPTDASAAAQNLFATESLTSPVVVEVATAETRFLQLKIPTQKIIEKINHYPASNDHQ